MEKREKINWDSYPLGDRQNGLSEGDAALRHDAGLDNSYNAKTGKTYGEIFKSNLLQFFNFVLYGIVVLFLIFSAILNAQGRHDLVTAHFGFSKYLFVGPVTINIIISIIQEIRSKKILDKLRLVTEAKSTVIRDGQKVRIPSSSIVYGDLIELTLGEQVPVDMEVVSGHGEVDESMLTGESEPVGKSEEAGQNFAYAGSYLTSGSFVGLAVKVGEATYANQLSKKVKSITKTKSQLMKSIYNIINVMAFVLLIMLVLVMGTMIAKVLIHGDDPNIFDPPMSLSYAETWAKMTVTAAAFAIGVLPTGLVLVTSITLAASVIILARQNTLIQELYSLENLSRVDTICLDKTGTLTDGTMNVEEVFYLQGSEEENKPYLSTLISSMKSLNQTGIALKEYFGDEALFQVAKDIPFSSAKKYSGAILDNGEELYLGAPEFLTKDKEVLAQAEEYAKKGMRVLLFVRQNKPIALIVLKDGIRLSAPETIAFFVENAVNVKIISGDNVETVSKIASLCGVPGAEEAISLEGVDVSRMDELCHYTVFGRVSPEQKEALVDALQRQGHKVAMTGDGVNDILALRKANSSITFEKATDAAKSCADVVLLDNDFSHLKEVVGQGRKVVNNAQRSSVLFLMKTCFMVMMSLCLIPFPRGHMVFSIENIYLMQTAVIAVGGFLLSLEPTKKPITGTFRRNVYPKAIAAGLTMLIGALVPCVMNVFGAISNDNTTALISILTTVAGVAILIRNSRPFTKYRTFVFVAVLVSAAFLALALPKSYLGGLPTSSADILNGNFIHEFFQPWNSPVYTNLASQQSAWITMLVYAAVAYPCILLLEKIAIKAENAIGAKLAAKKEAAKGQE